jgi:dynein heavy chain
MFGTRYTLGKVTSGDLRSMSVHVPEEGTVFDFVLGTDKGSWSHWMKGRPKFDIPGDARFERVVVPTIDTVRNEWVVDQLITRGHHVLCVGDTGTGKSVSMLDKLRNGLDREVYDPIFLNFSARTSANMTQGIVDGRMNRRRKGVFGPPLGKKFVVFVDDLNMPAKETYGAQPPIELLRQWMDHEGWYDLADKDGSFMRLVDIQFVAAMGPPGGGRTRITQRYVRHFNVLGFVPFDSDSLRMVFETMMSWSLAAFGMPIKSLVKTMVAATIDLYETISAELLPTPAKSHYTFNLRDLSKVFQGVNQGHADRIKDGADLIRLWGHECMRVFHDRLISAEDRTWFHNTLAVKCKDHFKKDWAREVRGPNETLVYGNFANKKGADNIYEEIDDRDHLTKVLAEKLEDYNAMSAKPMHLVLFMNAMEHIARISRVLAQPGGNALLVGVGGSGRKSLTTLATFVADYKLYQVEISKAYGFTEWRENLKEVLMMAGKDGDNTVFLFSDTQIVMESFVEDINNILNNGEVPNLYEVDERNIILEDVGKAARKEGLQFFTPTETWGYFVERCKSNLHIVLCFSPIGDAFRTRLRMFPSLVNCCTIDWFTEWPQEALLSVARHFLGKVELEDEVRDGVIDVCVDMQTRVSKLTSRFYEELRRHYYVTPTSYLELINTFQNLIGQKQDELLSAKARYDNGLDKLRTTAESVADMQQELTDLQPKLKVAQKETAAMLEKIAVMQKQAEEKAVVVEAEAAKCEQQAAGAQKIKDECEAELAEAIPALEAAVKALRTLKKSDITEVKAMKKPPDGVKLTMEAVCIMMSVKPKRVANPAGKGKIDDYWEPAQKMLADSKFLEKLMKYDKDNIPVDIMEKVRPYSKRDDFQPPVVLKASVAAGGLCKWVHAMVVYDRVAKVVAPKREALKAAEAEFAEAQTALAAKEAELKEVQDQVQRLQEELAETQRKKAELEQQVDDCSKKLDRAQRLIGGLGGEKTRWTEAAARLQQQYDNVVGDIVLSAGLIAYLGAFTSQYREECVEEWGTLLRSKGIACAEEFSLASTLGDAVQIRAWTINKLPNDSFSIDNAIMLYKSKRWPLMIDPQGQANKWVRNTEAENGLKVVKQNQSNFVRTIENAIQFGAPVLLENVPETIDPVLESVLLRQVVKVGGVMTIRVGDNSVEYDPNFRLYITTKLRNPHYSPETCVKVNLLNFMATFEGLQDQMLGIVVKQERPDLEAQREKLVLEDADNKRQLKEIEDRILHLLASSEGNILDDEELIETLSQSKVTSNQIMSQVAVAEKTQAKINATRAGYRPVAKRASLLFFCIADLAGVDPMYQYSLEWYVNLFLLAIDKAEQNSNMEERLQNLNDTFTYVLYENVCRSLFEKDKLLFSFLLCIKIMQGDDALDAQELAFFLQGSSSMDLAEPNPTASGRHWLTDKSWADLLDLCKLPAFAKFMPFFKSNVSTWESAFDATDPSAEIASICEGAGLEYTLFQRLLVLRCLRPDKVVPLVQDFISEAIGKQFIDPPTFDLMRCFDDSSVVSPLIFVLSPGADPMTELLKLADRLGKSKQLFSVSLGQGQGPIAESAISEAVDKGTWVCLQNCHLAESWMPTLERICEEITPDNTAESFRLWLTSMPSGAFPVSVLQNGVKMTLEPPKGMRASLLGSYHALDEEWFEGCERPREFKKMVFGLCFFHAIVRERRKFGPLGWNIPYEFSEPDLRISLDQLKIFLDDPAFPTIPFEALAYLVGECNYGGRVTDDKDRRCILNILSDFYTADILEEGYTFSQSGTYFAPPEADLASYIDYVRSLPFTESPEVFGLHDNADISCAMRETNDLLNTALSLAPRAASGSGKSADETLLELAADIEKRMPDIFDIEQVSVDYPVKFEESMNTVLVQELIRFNRLLAVVKRSLADVQKAIKGIVVMSGELEALGGAMVKGFVPAMWTAVSYPSLKPLGSYINDLLARLSFLNTWIKHDKPAVYWISGFFFTQSFLTGTRQNFARKYTIPIDEISFDFRVLTPEESESITEGAADGAYVRGLFLEGARWDPVHGCLAESRPKELYTSMPVIHLLPKETKDIDETVHVYSCPVYKTSERRGQLSTTGHSTNFVMPIWLPMAAEHTAKHWIKMGVAMLTQLDD